MSGAGEEQFAALIGYKFDRPERLELALTHSSWVAENSVFRGETKGTPSTEESGGGQAPPATEDNEKYEFLGDAVLALVVSESLLELFPAWKEGQLSKARASLVNAGALAEAARRLNLGAHLRLGRGEEKTGGREKPALLADAYEAVVAAIFLDGGLNAVRRFIERSLLDAALEGIAKQGGRLGEPDHKSRLQEFLQARGWPTAEYRVLHETGPDHQKIFVVEARIPGRATAEGTGKNKKEAEQDAAQGALAQILESAGRETKPESSDESPGVGAKGTNG